MKLKPMSNTASINIVDNKNVNNSLNRNQFLDRDPKGQLPPSTFRIIKKEKNIRIISIVFWLVVFLSSLLVILLTKFIPTLKQYSAAGIFILFGILLFISFILLVKNSIDYTSWSRVVKNLRESFSNGDASANVLFHKTYRNLIIKNVRLMWLVIFFETYYGLFTLITFLLYRYFIADEAGSGKIIVGSPESQLYFTFDVRQFLMSFYNGSPFLFLVFSIIALLSAIGIYTFVWMYDRKRQNDLINYIGESAHEIFEKVNLSKEKENKMWLKIYIFTFCILVILPLFLLILFIWKNIIRRKK